jgi:hypothetical protein
MSEFKFAPEFVSVDELEVLCQHYQQQLDDIDDQMWFIGNNSRIESEIKEYQDLLEKKEPLLKRKYYIQRCIKNRSKDANTRVQSRADGPGREHE